MKKYEFQAKSSGELFKVINLELPQLNYLQLQTALRKKDIKVNGCRVKSKITVLQKDKIEIYFADEKETVIETVYEDENVQICFKPAGIETTTKDKAYSSKTLEELTHNTAVHRLDKNTEGLVILAKNQKTVDEFIKGFKKSAINKYYKALVFGNFKQKQENLTAFLVKLEDKNLVKIFNKEVKNSALIKTNITVLEEFKGMSLLEIEIPTGKTHQIRAHLAFVNHSIVGDNKYGNKANNKKYPYKKQCLTSYKLSFNFGKTSFLNYLNNIVVEGKPTWNTPEKINNSQN